ncbi:hypothetical protein VM1G_11983 [Cytospora mali]|uniref:Uncharacterized protein n=1 Tax=Cytospora mali TaxID=578113 RepID=A0A194WE39_CYTMA|nr:hypothetical protein VM1G_11983 [Valsa mali]
MNPHSLPLLPRNISPLLDGDPPDIRAVTKPTDPVHRRDHEAHPLGRVDPVPGEPVLGVRVVPEETRLQRLGLGLGGGRDVLEVAEQGEAREVGGAVGHGVVARREHLVVPLPFVSPPCCCCCWPPSEPAAQPRGRAGGLDALLGRVGRHPVHADAHVAAGLDVLEARGDLDGQDGRVALLFGAAVGYVVHQPDGDAAEVVRAVLEGVGVVFILGLGGEDSGEGGEGR